MKSNEFLMEDKAQMFTYLDELRESGITNMFGAAPYLCGHFGILMPEAREVLSDWMQTYDPGLTPAERVYLIR